MVKIALDQKLKFRLMVASVVLTFAGIVFGFYVLQDLVAKVGEGKIKIAEKDRDIEIINKNISDSQEYGGEIEKIKSAFPLEYHEVAFFTSQIETLAQNNGLTLQTSIDKDLNEKKGETSSIIYLIKFSGSYTQIADFLSQISKLKFLTRFDDLKLTASESVINADVKFRLFVRK